MIYGENPIIIELIDLDADMNSLNTVTESLDLSQISQGILSFFVIPKSGDHDVHEVVLQVSPDNNVWIDTEYALIGPGCKDANVMGSRYVRLKVSRVQGVESTSDLYIQAR